MASKTRFGWDGAYTRRAGSFAGKTYTAPPANITGPVKLTGGISSRGRLQGGVRQAGKLTGSVSMNRTITP